MKGRRTFPRSGGENHRLQSIPVTCLNGARDDQNNNRVLAVPLTIRGSQKSHYCKVRLKTVEVRFRPTSVDHHAPCSSQQIMECKAKLTILDRFIAAHRLHKHNRVSTRR